MFQRTEEEICRIGRNGLVDINDPRLPVLLEQRARTGKARGELTMLRENGSKFPVELSTSVFVDRNGEKKTSMIICDITERKRAEEALRASEEELHLTLDATTDGIYKWNLKTKVLFFSPRYYTMLGYDPGELPATYETWKSLIHPDDLAGTLRVAEDYLVTKPDRYENEFRMRTKAGGYRWIHAQPKGVERDEHGDAVRIIGNHQDITERKRMEGALRASEDRHRDLVENSQDLICTHDLKGNLLSVNEAASGLTGYSRERLLQMNMSELLAPEVRERFDAYLTKIKMKGLANGILKMQTAAGEIRYWEYHNTLRTGELVAPIVRGMAYDITTRMQAEEELRACREPMRALAGRLQAVREGERTQIAREIHDELGGALTGMKIDFSLLTRAALKIEDETVRTSLLAGMDSMIKSIDATIQTVRRIAMELRPGVLDDLGLVAALEWQLKTFEKRT